MNDLVNTVADSFLADIIVKTIDSGDPQDYAIGDPADYELGTPAISDDEARFMDKLIAKYGLNEKVIMDALEAASSKEEETGGFSDFFKKLKSKASGVIEAVKKNPTVLLDPIGATSAIVKNIKKDESRKKQSAIQKKIDAAKLNENAGAPTTFVDKNKAKEITPETGMSFIQVGKNSDLIKPPIPSNARVNPRFFKTIQRVNYAWFPTLPIIVTDVIPLGGIYTKVIQPTVSGEKCVFNAISFTMGSNDFKQSAGATYTTKISGFDVSSRAFNSGDLRQTLNMNSRIGSLLVIPWIVINTKPYMDALCITKDHVEKFISLNDSTGNPCTSIANNVGLTVEIKGTEAAALTIQIFTVDNDLGEMILTGVSKVA